LENLWLELWLKLQNTICPTMNIGNKRCKVNRIFAVVA